MIQHFRDEIELDEHLSGLLLRALRANGIDKYLFRQRRWGWEIDFSVGVADRRQRFHAEFNTQENNRFTLLNPARAAFGNNDFRRGPVNVDVIRLSAIYDRLD